jgi:hypothetical protein
MAAPCPPLLSDQAALTEASFADHADDGAATTLQIGQGMAERRQFALAADQRWIESPSPGGDLGSALRLSTR